MKSKIPSSFPVSHSEFNFPSWPESSTDSPPFILPNFPAADARDRIPTDSRESDSNPFFAATPETQPKNPNEGEISPQSPFGIPLSSLEPAPASHSRRLPSLVAKTALICLFAAIGWIGYGEYVSGSSESTVAKWKSFASAWLLPEEELADSQPVETETFIAKAMVPTLEISTPQAPKRVTTTDIRRQISKSAGKDASDLYLKLASLHQSFGAVEEAEESLREGLAKDTANADLILSLADTLSDQGKKDEAWLLLAKSTRTGDKRFGSRILVLGLATGKHDETLMILDPEAPGAPKWNNEDWITIALLYQKSGNTERALELLQIYDKERIHSGRTVV